VNSVCDDKVTVLGGETVQRNPAVVDQAAEPQANQDSILDWESTVVYRVEVRLEQQPEGGYSVYVPALPGAVSEGETVEEAKNNMREALTGLVRSYCEAGEKIPWVEEVSRAENNEISKWIIFRA